MTAPIDVQSLTGATLSISATLPATYDQAGYESTDIVWTAVGKVEDMGEHGGSKTISTFIDVETGTVNKVGGSIDWGQMNVVLGNLAGDSGQQLMRTAMANRNTHYSIKVAYDDAGAVTDEVHYLDVIVGSFVNQDGNADNVRRVNVQLAVCKQPVIVAPT